MTRPTTVLLLAALSVLCMSRPADADDITPCGKLKLDDGLNNSVESVAFSPDGTILASANNVLVGAQPWISKKGGQGGTIKGHVALWNVVKKQMVDTIDCQGHVQLVTFSPDGKLLAVAHSDDEGKHKVRILDLATRKARHSLSIENKGLLSISAMTFTPNGKRLVVGTGRYPQGGEAVVFDTETGKKTGALKGGELSIGSLSFSADGKLMVSVSEDIVQIWDMASEKERNSFPAGRGNLAAISPDGDTIAVSTTGSRKYAGKVALTLCDAKTGKERVDLQCLRTVTAFLFTPDGRKLICGHNHGIIAMYNVASGKRISSTDGPTFSSLAMTRAGNLIATGNYSGTIWLWNIGERK